MIAGLLWRGWRLAGRARTARFHAALDHPRATQERLLRTLLRRHADCEYGRRHGFARLTSAAAFQAQVPLAGWSDVAPAVARLRAGASGVLTSDTVTRLVPTSGSAAARKLIPWTAGLASGFANALAPWLDDLMRRHPDIVDGPAYWCITPPAGGPEPAGALAEGFASDRAYLGGRWQALLGRAMAVPDRVIDAADPLRATLLHLLRCAELRLVSVWHPSFLDLLLDRLQRDLPALLDQLAAGDPAIGLRAAPGRAAHLRHADPARLRSLWPRLALVSAWADGPAAVPARALAARLGAVPLQPKGLLATEGVVTIPCAGGHPLALTSQVFEFLDDRGRCRWADELVAGGEYEVVLSNGGGLWRYRLGDRVRVTARLGRTPCLAFLGRSGTVHDLAGEKLDEGLAAQVLAGLLPQAAFAALQPEPALRRWRLVVDRHTVIDATLAARLEARLMQVEHWRIARQLGQLAPPVVVASRLSGAELLQALARQRRQRLGEVKPPALLAADLDPGVDPLPSPGAGRATG